jgi:hypothetical protein
MHRRFLRLLLVSGLVVSLSGATSRTLVAQTPPRPDTAAASRTDSLTEVRLRDGSVLYGRVEREQGDSLVLRTGAGVRVALPLAQVEGRRTVAGRLVGGAFWLEDPNRTRLFFTSTGRPLRKGEGYVSGFFLFFPFVAVGVTDRLTLAAGTPVIPEVIGRVFYVAPKFTLIDRPRSSFAVGAISFALTEEIDEGTIGLAYGVGTWGDRDDAISAGAGWGYRWGGTDSDVASSPVLMLGGERRTGRRTKLVTENWIFTGDGGGGAIVTGGVRLIGERFSADLGIGGGLGWDEAFCCLPIVNVVWAFGR